MTKGSLRGRLIQAVSDQELGGAVEADVRQALAGGGVRTGRGEAGDAVGGVGPVAGALAGGREDERGVLGEVAGEERGLLAGVDRAGRGRRRSRGRRG